MIGDTIHVYAVPSAEVNGRCSIARDEVPNSGYTDEAGKTIPCLPGDRRVTETTDQATRQYLRGIGSVLYRGDARNERSKLSALMMLLATYVQNVDVWVKSSLASLACTLLKKTFPHRKDMEVDVLRGGEPHVPLDGQSVTDALSSLAPKIYGKDIDGALLWMGICLMVDSVLGDDVLSTNQAPHTKLSDDDIGGALATLRDILPKVHFEKLAPRTDYEFTCPLFLYDTSAGGWKMKDHNWGGVAGSTCSRKEILCNDAYNEMKEQGFGQCAFCRARLELHDFEHVKKEESDFKFPEGLFDMSVDGFAPRTRQMAGVAALPMPGDDEEGKLGPAAAAPVAGIIQAVGSLSVAGQNVCIEMNGTVGCGKSSATAMMEDKLRAAFPGCGVLVASVDREYVRLCESGYNPKRAFGPAIGQVKNNVQAFLGDCNGKRKFVIVDTCGAQNSGKDIFGVKAPGWAYTQFYPNLYDRRAMTDSEWNEYFAWTLRNVLLRSRCGKSSRPGGFSLNPDDVSVSKVVDIHRDKAQSSLNRAPTGNYRGSKNDIIQRLTRDADSYAGKHSLKDMEKAIDDLVGSFH